MKERKLDLEFANRLKSIDLDDDIDDDDNKVDSTSKQKSSKNIKWI